MYSKKCVCVCYFRDQIYLIWHCCSELPLTPTVDPEPTVMVKLLALIFFSPTHMSPFLLFTHFLRVLALFSHSLRREWRKSGLWWRYSLVFCKVNVTTELKMAPKKQFDKLLVKLLCLWDQMAKGKIWSYQIVFILWKFKPVLIFMVKHECKWHVFALFLPLLVSGFFSPFSFKETHS